MKKFLLTGTLFFLGFFLLDKTLILLRNYAPKNEVDKRLEMILNGKINSEILIYGSSRGARDIMAAQLGKSLGSTAYNLSYPGSGIEFHEFLLEQTLKNGNKKPSLVILVVDDPTELLPNSILNFRLDRLYPLVKYPVIREQLEERDGKNEYLNKLFIVSQLGISNFNVTQKHFKKLDTLLVDGSMPISSKDPRFDEKYVPNTSPYDIKEEVPSNLRSFLNFIDLCKVNGIKLLLTSPPNFYKSTVGFNERLKELAKDNANYYLFNNNRPYTKESGYYFDDVHLKKKGAVIFTKELGTYIKENNLLLNSN